MSAKKHRCLLCFFAFAILESVHEKAGSVRKFKTWNIDACMCGVDKNAGLSK